MSVTKILGIGVLAAVATVSINAAQQQKFGAEVKVAEATAIKALYEQPEKYVGKTIRLDGVITAVCEEMGCWLAMAAADAPEQTIRFKVGHDAGISFPMTIKGKRASAEGVFEKLAKDDKEGQEAAGEQAKQSKAASKAADFGKTYQMKTAGVIVY